MGHEAKRKAAEPEAAGGGGGGGGGGGDATAGSSSNVLSLPTGSETASALSLYRSAPVDDGPWRSMVLRALAYGTDYDTAVPSSSAGGGGSKDGRTSPANMPDRPPSDLATRALEAARYLADSLGGFAPQPSDGAKDGGGDSGSGSEGGATKASASASASAAAAASGPQIAVVDALWLVGCILAPDDAAGASRADAKPAEVRRRYECLAKIVSALAFGTDLDGKSDVGPPYLPIRLLQTSLEPQLLASSRLLADSASSSAQANSGLDHMLKRLRKINTDMHYRQTRFNLLAEESEGYAKLLVLLGGLPGGDGDAGGGDDDSAAQRVRELIGAFDLDPNRVLDLTLDAMESEVKSLLLENANSNAGKSGLDRILTHAPNHAAAISTLLGIVRGFKRESLPHLLGFKFTSYANSGGSGNGAKTADKAGTAGDKGQKDETGGVGTPAPRSLYVLTTLLTIHGLLDAPALVPHLSPTSDSILESYERFGKEYGKKIRKMGVVSLNATNAGEEKKEDGAGSGGGGSSSAAAAGRHDCGNQLIELFQTLIEAGAPWDVATSLFGGATTSGISNGGVGYGTGPDSGAAACCSLHPPAGQQVCAWVRRAVKGAHDARVGDLGAQLLRPASSSSSGTKGSSAAAAAKSGEKLGGRSDGKFSLLPRGSGEGGNKVPSIELSSASTLEDVVTMLEGPLAVIASSGCIRHEPTLYCTLCRLFRSLLIDAEEKEGKADAIDEKTYKLLRTFLVPSLSMYPSNPSISSELWSVLKLLPYQIRYGLYGSWRISGLEKAALRTIPQTKPLPNIESEVTTGMSARYTLKRLSKDNIRDMGRQLSKASHNNPLVVFTAILNQIESYDNLILMMVETFKHVTLLSLDVVGYCLLVALGGGDSEGGRSKLKEDGVNAAQWLSSLETFTGAFYKKFPDVELRGILCYLIKRLKDGEVLELGVLRTLLKTAGGYGFADCESTASLSEVQLDGRAGSQLLKRETSDFGIVEKSNRRATMKLRSVLQGDDVGAVILILLSQIRSRILYHTSKSSPKHIKLIGNLYDNAQMVMGVMLDFLTDSTEEQKPGVPSTKAALGHSMSVSIARYAASLPELGDLYRDYGVEPAVAWMLCRPLIRAAMFVEEEKASVPPHLAPYLPSSDSMCGTYHAMLPESCWKYITPDLFETFYSHSLYDVHCPESRYAVEIARLDKEKERLTQLKQGGGEAAKASMAAMAAAAAAAGGTQREIREATAFTKAHEQDLERVTTNSEILASGLKRQMKHCEAVRKKIASQKASLLSALGQDNVEQLTAQTFLTYCVYPRCLLSPEDAAYCAQFVSLLHTMETPGFSTLKYFEGLVNAIVGALYSITEDEAGNLSLLLEETWKLVNRWRYDEQLFEKEVAGKPGSLMEGVDGDNKGISYVDFKKLYNRWHATLGEAFVGCLKSSEYIHTRAALIVLTRVVRVYPTRPALGERMIMALSPLQEDTNRQDINAMAQGYASHLLKARDEGVWEEDSAITKARKEKEKHRMEERRKNAEKQFEEMKQESEAISREMGDGRTRGWDDRNRPHPRGGDQRGAHPDARAVKSPLTATAATFTPAGGGQARELNNHPPPASRGAPGGAESRDRPRDWDRDRDRDPRDHSRRSSRERDHHHPNQEPRNTKWERDRAAGDERGGGAPPASGPNAQHGRGGGGQATGSSLEGRWQRGGGPGGQGDRQDGRGLKRSRSPPQEVGAHGTQDRGDRRDEGDQQEAKRLRVERSGGGHGPGGDDGRRGDGRATRGTSPPRGGRRGAPPPAPQGERGGNRRRSR